MDVSLREGSPETERVDRGTQSVRFPISHEADVGQARRVVRDYAVRCGLDEEDAERLALVVTECGNNIVRHAGSIGSIVFSRVPGPETGFEILAIDEGPGIADVGFALEDGFSTAGTAGVGLGAIRRQSDEFDVHSTPDEGTVVLSRIYRDRVMPAEASRIAAVCLPRGGETVSGDAWIARHEAGVVSIMLADGLGHGYAAADAANLAVETFCRDAREDPASCMKTMHDALRSTRGAAISVAQIRPDGALGYCGVGNVRTILTSIDRTQELIAMNGTAGHRARRIRTFDYEGAREAILVMHSDGLRSRWKLDQFRALRLKHPAVIAGVLLRGCERGTDDVCVVVWKGEEA